MLFMKHLISAILILIVFSCSNSPRYRTGPSKPSSPKSKSLPSLKTKSKVKHKKVIKGVSSFYAKDFHGKLTANGEVYDMYGLTAAHKTLPLNTIARVTNLENNKSLILRINDRGPYVEGRILDCSYGVAREAPTVHDHATQTIVVLIIPSRSVTFPHLGQCWS